jgi:hypothetical protein
VRGDQYGGAWPADVFSECKIAYEVSELTKSEIYLEFLPHLNSGVVDLLDNQTLVNQLCSLERRTARGGRDTVDHPKAGYDDVINSAAGALQLVLSRADEPLHVSAEAVARARAMPPRRAYRFN